MSIQPPRGHLPAHIAPLYVMARALLEAYPKEGKRTFDPTPFSDSICSPLGASMTFDGERRSFSAKVCDFKPSQIGVELHLELVLEPRIVPRKIRPFHTVPKSLAIAERPVIEEGEPTETEQDLPLTDEEKAEEARARKRAEVAEAAARKPKGVTVTLVSPHDTCLETEILSATAQWHGLRGLPQTAYGPRTFPADAYFRFPRIGRRLVKELRNVLAESGGRAVLIERTGQEWPVPPRYWRSEAAEAVLAGDVETTVVLEDSTETTKAIEATGTVWFDEVALDAAWRWIRGTAAMRVKEGDHIQEGETHTAVPQPTAWMIFMQEVALLLGYSGGKPVGKNRFSREELKNQLRKLWPEHLGAWSEDYAEAMAAFILHPSNRKAANPPTTTREERERTQAQLGVKKKIGAGKKIGR